MGRGEPDVFRFGEFELDPRAVELRRSGQSVRIFPRAFDLLLYLLKHRDRVVPREELLEALWPGVTVTNAVLTQTVWELRKVLGDGAEAELIRNARGRGYRFVGKLDAVEAPEQPAPSAPAPVAVRPPLAPTAPKDPQRGPRAQSSFAYVGREAEMSRLRVALDGALEGRGAVVLLGGEPGIGKTRAAEELMSVARERGAAVFDGCCYESEGGPPFWPWLQIVRRIIDESSAPVLRDYMGSGAPDLCRFCPELRTIMPEVPEPPARPSEQDRFYLLDSVASFLTRAAQVRPIALVLDDLQWADRASLLLLEMLARMAPRARMLVLGTYRTTELEGPQPFAQSLASFAKSSECIVLSGLTEREVAELLCGEVQSLDPRLAAQVHHITGGNPLFVQHVARLLVSDEQRSALENGQLALPDEVREAIGKRIAQLPADCVEVLRCAAAIGQRFRFNDLRLATERKHDELLGLLQIAADARIVCEDRLGVYRFAHPLIREGLHQSLRMPKRALLHQRIGQVIEAQSVEGDSTRDEELAYHFCEAAAIGSAEKAVGYAERAAARAFAATAYETAAEYYEKALRALELTAPIDIVRGAELRIARGQALRGANQDPARVRAEFLEVAELAKSRKDAKLLARAALGYSGMGPLRIRQIREAGTVDPIEVSLLEQALGALPDGDSDLRALSLGQLAHALYNTRERKRREHLAGAAVDMARRLGDPYTLAEALLAKHRVITAPDQLDERLTLTSEILSLTQVMELRDLELDAHVQRAFLLLQKGQIAAAEADMAESIRLAEVMQQPDEKDSAGYFDMLRMYWEGRFEEGERESLALAQRRFHRGGAALDQGHQIRVLVARWLQGKAAEGVDALLAFAEKYPLPVVWRCSLTATYASAERDDLVRRELDRLAVNDFEDLPFDHNWLSCHFYLSSVCVYLHDRERAALIYRAIQPYADRYILLGHQSTYVGPVYLPLARVAGVLELWDEAEAAYEQAIARNAAFGAPVWTALCQLEYAEVLWTRGFSGDRRKARPILDAALATARALGLGEIPNRAARLPDSPSAQELGLGGSGAILSKS
jgi:predicted ATPase/DNA-binding winged helix-turn-helix (wHTH) protein